MFTLFPAEQARIYTKYSMDNLSREKVLNLNHKYCEVIFVGFSLNEKTKISDLLKRGIFKIHIKLVFRSEYFNA